jgi:hypothetical protein
VIKINVRRFTVLVMLIAALLAGCSGAAQTGGAAKAVEAYLQALASRDLNQMIGATCADWESQARLEYDSFAAVKLELKDLSCQETGQDQSSTLVACSGTIIANYGAEDLQIDVADQTFQVIQEGGEWRVCGYLSTQ